MTSPRDLSNVTSNDPALPATSMKLGSPTSENAFRIASRRAMRSTLKGSALVSWNWVRCWNLAVKYPIMPVSAEIARCCTSGVVLTTP